MKNRSYFLKIASDIFANGRIENPEDWEEMKIELEHEFRERNLPDELQKEGLRIVQSYWY